MPILQTTDGRLLRRSRPTGLSNVNTFAGPMERWTDATEALSDRPGERVLSYAQVYAEQPVVAAAINKLSRQIATLPLKVYQRKGDNERERVRDHPLDQLLRRPLSRRGSVSLKWWLIFDCLLHGNSLLAKVRQAPDEAPYAIFPLLWSKVAAYASEGQPIEWWSTTQFGSERFFPVEESIHVSWGGATGEVGISPLEQLGVTVQLEDAARRQQRSWFRNGVRPSIVISPGMQDGRMPSKEILDFTKASLEKVHKGVDNSAKALLVAPGSNVSTVQMDATEVQLIEGRLLNREEVAMCYDLPPPLLGDLRHATLANVKEFGRQFYTDIIRPWLTLIEETIQSHLIDSEPSWAMDDLYVEFDLAEQLKGEPKELATTIEIQIRSGQMTPNEGRALLNLPPDGDPNDPENPANRLYMPVNNLQPIGTETGTAPQAVQDPAATVPETPEPEPPTPPAGAQNTA